MKKFLGIMILSMLFMGSVYADEKFKGFLKCDKMFTIYIDETNKFAEIGEKKFELYSTKTQFEIIRQDKLLGTEEVIFINRLIGYISYMKQKKNSDNTVDISTKDSFCEKIDKKF